MLHRGVFALTHSLACVLFIDYGGKDRFIGVHTTLVSNKLTFMYLELYREIHIGKYHVKNLMNLT